MEVESASLAFISIVDGPCLEYTGSWTTGSSRRLCAGARESAQLLLNLPQTKAADQSPCAGWSAACMDGGFRSSCADPRAPCIGTPTCSRFPDPRIAADFNEDPCMPRPANRPPAHRCSLSATRGQVWASWRPPDHLYGLGATSGWVWALFC